MFKRKKHTKTTTFDTSKEAWEAIGIHVTEAQYRDLADINFFMVGDAARNDIHIPVHYIMLVLKILGLLPENPPKESVDIITEQPHEVWYEELQKKFGRLKER